MRPDYALRGKTVVLTGAAGGIGQALAHAFAGQGVHLLLLDRSADALQPLVQTLQWQTSVECLACDLNDDAQVTQLAQGLRERGTTVDVLVNNAGSEYPTPIDGATDDAMVRWAALLDNNVVSMVRLTRALLPLMPTGASVINQSSIWGKTGVAGFSAYAASKHAVIGLTRSLAFELAGRGIRVNAVCPGWVRTAAAMRSLQAMAAEQGRSESEVERDLLALQAVPEMLAPEDIAGVYLFLASADAKPLTGQALVASHGEVMS